MKFAVGDKVLLAEESGYLSLGPQGIILAVDEDDPTYPYRVAVVQPDGTVDALVFAEDELRNMMSTFEIGQRVRVTTTGAEWDGEEATITGTDPLDLWDYEVKMDRRYNDEGVSICDPEGISWFDEYELEAI